MAELGGSDSALPGLIHMVGKLEAGAWLGCWER